MEIKNFFIKNGFFEIDTPTLVESPGLESYLEPFKTEYFDYNKNRIDYYLPTSPEFSLKEVLTTGLEKIFEIKKCFRNFGENSNLHNPEFYLLEWYRCYENYEKIMEDCKNLLIFLSKKILKKNIVNYKNYKIDFSKIKKIKLKDLFKNYNIELDDYTLNEQKFIDNISNKLKINNGNLTKEDLFFKFFLQFIEPDLGFDFPTIIYEYPVEMARLSRKSNNFYGERFELFICGIEIANGYGELTDPFEQEKNFIETINFRNSNNCIYNLKLPDRFLKSLKQGIPNCSGVALGIERLFMILMNIDNIKDINLF